jgi:hypothetical protein
MILVKEHDWYDTMNNSLALEYRDLLKQSS